ncbi:MAG: DMT family transporter [Acetobacter sp.]|nr:DMT family transporter [Bacteroides sp.]MCM1340260.1 DMT family transporter [Acetobacter sp.]MCM1432790.1 DMT family transporter [Clostridiales bacterium]
MKKSFIKYIFALLLFGSNGIIASRISLNSSEIVLWRTFTGSLFLILLFVLSKNKLTFYKHKKDFVSLCISGIAMGASWMFLYEAYQQIGVSISSLCYYCGPIIVMILSPLIFNEKMTKNKIASFIVVIIGIILVNNQAVETSRNMWGIFCGLLSAIMYSLMVIFNKKAKTITGIENSMLQLFISFLTVMVFVGIKQGFNINIGKENIMPIIILGLINTGLGCYLYFSSINDLPVQIVAICGYLEPLSAVVFSVLFLKETMLPLQIIGAVLIIGSAVFSKLADKNYN